MLRGIGVYDSPAFPLPLPLWIPASAGMTGFRPTNEGCRANHSSNNRTSHQAANRTEILKSFQSFQSQFRQPQIL